MIKNFFTKHMHYPDQLQEYKIEYDDNCENATLYTDHSGVSDTMEQEIHLTTADSVEGEITIKIDGRKPFKLHYYELDALVVMFNEIQAITGQSYELMELRKQKR